MKYGNECNNKELRKALGICTNLTMHSPKFIKGMAEIMKNDIVERADLERFIKDFPQPIIFRAIKPSKFGFFNKKHFRYKRDKPWLVLVSVSHIDKSLENHVIDVLAETTRVIDKFLGGVLNVEKRGVNTKVALFAKQFIKGYSLVN